MNAIVQNIPELPLSKRLKAGTTRDHDSVDNLVMGSRPFESHERYAHFLHLQHRFHGVINWLYQNEELNQMLPGLQELPRFDAVCVDLADLGLSVPAEPQPVRPASSHAALGWLYCAEGSNLGAAFLFKQTQKIGLDGDNGARHLAAHPDGRALHWRQFIAQLDALALTPAQADEAVRGAVEAFNYYRAALREIFAVELT